MINGARQPPRPTPSMVNYSDEDSAKGYDENPDDSDSLTEKPSEISSTDSQVSIFIHISKLYTPSTLNIQIKLILLWVWAERAVLGRAKTALKFKYEIEIG